MVIKMEVIFPKPKYFKIFSKYQNVLEHVLENGMFPSPGLHSCPTARRSGKKKPWEAALVDSFGQTLIPNCIPSMGFNGI